MKLTKTFLVSLITFASAAPRPDFKDDVHRHMQNRRPVILPRVTDDACDFETHAVSAAQALQTSYNQSDGTWENMWWESANCLYALADLTLKVPSTHSTYDSVVANTFVTAQQRNLRKNNQNADQVSNSNAVAVDGGFNNAFYDDSGWWGLAWIKAFDTTNNGQYLEAAKHVFEYIAASWDDTCGGGVWWSTEKSYKNAITNELFLCLGAALANRVPSYKTYYLNWAQKEWTWFQNSGMINGDNLINDGLEPSTCKNNGQNVYTYNQGVILGGLIELSKAENGGDYINHASTLSQASVMHFDDGGVLTEGCEGGASKCEGAQQFKGIYLRYLGDLQKASQNEYVRKFIVQQAIYLREMDAAGDNVYSIDWDGPSDASLDASSQSSALTAFMEAINVGGCKSGDEDINSPGSDSSGSSTSSGVSSSTSFSTLSKSSSGSSSSISSRISSSLKVSVSASSTVSSSSTVPVSSTDSASSSITSSATASSSATSVSSGPVTVVVGTVTASPYHSHSIDTTIVKTITAEAVTAGAASINIGVESADGLAGGATGVEKGEDAIGAKPNLIIVTRLTTLQPSIEHVTVVKNELYTAVVTAFGPVQTQYVTASA